jgi:hypothetical protein
MIVFQLALRFSFVELGVTNAAAPFVANSARDGRGLAIRSFDDLSLCD